MHTHMNKCTSGRWSQIEHQIVENNWFIYKLQCGANELLAINIVIKMEILFSQHFSNLKYRKYTFKFYILSLGI